MRKNSLNLFEAKKTVFALFFLALASAAVFFLRPRSPIDFDYISIGCRIFKTDGTLVFGDDRSYLCDHKSDGHLLQMGAGLYNSRGGLVYSQKGVVHHDYKFSPDGKFTLTIEAQDMSLDGKLHKVDCVVRRTLTGDVDARWCLGDHLAELARDGYFFEPWPRVSYPGNPEIKARSELSHANSIFEIPENPLGHVDPAFAKGNYLLNLYGESNFMIIIDHDMKKYLKVFSMAQFPFPPTVGQPRFLAVAENKFDIRYQSMTVHDSKLLSDGNILSYGTQILGGGGDYVSNIIRQCIDKKSYVCGPGTHGGPRGKTIVFKWNPLHREKDLKVIWVADESKAIPGPIHGSVYELKNGNYLILDVGRPISKIFVVNSRGEKLWAFPSLFHKTALFSARPLYDLGFLKARGLLD